ncbi:hypothetical protein BDZ94DRAFT_334056 [Collybia nuda]|uniref:PIN domain-like protein n=1 Tax=Collybia nuda TaxID=64659 RepID=A0A9P6CD40_9AGAR|nr:hypothetical protein BDZ94DRAFT_334056 [Collybia nuda]
MGVKSLWNLLKPVGRPILLETVEGKIMAIDSSIWIYQFQATMRDNDGRALINAHVLGFLRRISKLLFYGIKPVFVFDGGAPALKKRTLRERREKKSGAAADHAKLAEKLLAAQMRREAFGRVRPDKSSVTISKRKTRALDDQTIYLEDVDPLRKTSTISKLPTPSLKKNQFYDHDPYRLPDVDVEEAVANAVQATAPDPRLATEEELRVFIEDMRPEDFDITSPAFRELPTEVQYEIVGDLRLKSRQTSYARLQKMLSSAPTPLDFSKQQIRNLRQRNTLTQQLLITTDSIGSAHISIPIRIASERNKEYVLIKNEGESGGWILGIKEDGTKQKPIEIDQDEKLDLDEDSEEDMEEVPISTHNTFDPDLRGYQQHMALSAIGNRTAKRLPLPQASTSKFIPGHSTEPSDEIMQTLFYNSGDDEELAFAINASLEEVHGKEVTSVDQRPQSIPTGIFKEHPAQWAMDTPLSHSSPEDVFASPSRLATTLSIANAGPSKWQDLYSSPVSEAKSFGRPLLLSSRMSPVVPLEQMEYFNDTHSSNLVASNLQNTVSAPVTNVRSNNRAKMITEKTDTQQRLKRATLAPSFPQEESYAHSDSEESVDVTPASDAHEALPEPSLVPQTSEVAPQVFQPSPSLFTEEYIEEPIIHWSRSPSPHNLPPINTGLFSTNNLPEDGEGVDPAGEDDFARFISKVKGKDIQDVIHELDDEIKFLDQQRKTAMRDSEDITQQMISQIMTMLRLFGIPYITAPMEAEAQCAELVSLGLVDGVITDDSDVFLFGARRVFKNMFNQSKTVECFLLSDLSRELGLERDTLIRLAYLLGSDYVDGLPGVGPVVALELLKEFPGEDGLHMFKDWWTRVQTGKDKDDESNSKFRKQFKKFKDLYLPADWPNPAIRDAYYHPTVDSSDEPFKWGTPDLDALRGFLREELGWGQDKVDEVLLPIIQKMRQRREVYLFKAFYCSPTTYHIGDSIE